MKAESPHRSHLAAALSPGVRRTASFAAEICGRPSADTKAQIATRNVYALNDEMKGI